MKNLSLRINSFIAFIGFLMLSAAVVAQTPMALSGPTVVCPNGTYSYTAGGAPWTTNQYRWKLSYNGYSVAASGTSSSSTFSVPFNSNSPGTAYVYIEAWNTNIPDAFNPVGSAPFPLNVTMQLKDPIVPNGGTVIFCGGNETVTVNSLPYLGNDINDCYFHYPYEWNAPGGWSWSQGYGSGNNSFNLNILAYAGGTNYLTSPGSVGTGNNGTVKVKALWNNSYWPAYGGSFTVNTESNATLWVGTPSVSNGLVNGSPGGTPTYVPGGYANLSVNVAGGGGVNWYVAQGSGSLNPSGSNCSISFSNFARVVADASNRCGNGGSWTFYLSTTQNYYGYRVGPNPARDKISVLLEMKEMAGEVIESVELYNEKTKLCAAVGADQLKAGKYDKTSIDLNVRDLPRGTYYLHINRKGAVDRQQVVLE